MEFTEISTEAAVALVDRRPGTATWPYPLFCTISPNPNTKHAIYKSVNGKRITVQMPYGKLPQRVQHAYCMRVLKHYIYSKDTKIFSTWELNQAGNVHLHLILSDPQINNDTMLKIFQRDILNSEIVMKNLSKKMIDYMNNIVKVNDSIAERIKYMTKDMKDNLPIMSYYGYNTPFFHTNNQKGA